MTSTPWYATREQVKFAADQQGTARSDREIDSAIEQSTDAIHELTGRESFAPYLGTETFDYPVSGYRGKRLYLGARSLIELTSATVGGVAVSTADLRLYPLTGPPYEWVETERDSSVSWRDADTPQGAVALTGRWGHSDDRQDTIGTLTAGVDGAVTSWPVSAAAAAVLGVGSLLTCGTEMVTITGRGWTSSGQTLQTPLTTSVTNQAVVVTDGTAFTTGEWLTLDAETMVITRITGSTLIVRRAVDGSVLATHTGSTIYVQRAVTVVRGDRGSTAAAHLISAAVTMWVPPALVHGLALAEALVTLGMRQRAYTTSTPRSAGKPAVQPPGGGLPDLREQVRAAYGHGVQHRAV